MPRKSTRASGSSPEKTSTRRATRRGQKASDETENSSEVADEIPRHLLRASDESSEHSDNDSDYGSPKKGGRGGRAGRGRTRKTREVKEVVEEKPTPTRPRRGRRAARDKTPETISEEPEQHSQEPPESINSQTDEHETSTIESEHTAEDEQQQQSTQVIPELIQPVEKEVEEEKPRSPSPEPPKQEIQETQEPPPSSPIVVAEKVSEVEQDLQSNNDQANNEVESTDGVVKNVDDDESMQSSGGHDDVELVKAKEPVVEEMDSTNDEVSKDAPELLPPPQEKQSSPERSRSNSSEPPKKEDIKVRSRSSSGEIREESSDTKMEVDEPIKAPQSEDTKPSEPKVSGHQRKRKWGARKIDSEPVIAITTDSLKNIISEEVKPVPLSDVKLVMSPSPDREPDEKRARTKSTAEDKDAKKKLLKERLRKQEEDEDRRSEQLSKVLEKRQTSPNITIVANGAGQERKVSLVHEESAAAPPTPPKNQTSKVLCITNLVRPLTVLSLKTLLVRTGKIADFWIDPIKSKCIVKFETEDEAVETRHALHGVKWPDHNLKTLNVEFSTEEELSKVTMGDRASAAAADSREAKTEKGFGWSKTDVQPTVEDRSKSSRRVREWDVGKKEETERDRSRDENRRRRRSSERENRRDKDETFEKRRSVSASPALEEKGDDVVVPAQPGRLLDDLFRKTKAVPCIYWLPLSEEQVKEKEEQRLKNLEEHKRRMDEMFRLRKEAREQRMREREKDRDRKRSRSNSRGRNRNRKSTSRDRRRSVSRDRRNRFDRR